MRLAEMLAIGLLVLGAAPAATQTQAPDTVLLNGKIVTVDDRFSIVQALAIRDGRVIALGTSSDISKLKGPQTRTIDLGGRTVIPGLIDNHAHWIRAAEHNELRFDGVTSRKRAIALLTERGKSETAGKWIAVLGGWSEQQFSDEERGFPRAELDAIAPNNPVVLQSVYNHSFLNSAALKATGIDENTPNPPGGEIEKDSAGRPTGLIRGAGGVAFVAAKIPLADEETWFANTRKLVFYLNSLGITAWSDLGGRGMSAKHYEPYRRLAKAGDLNARVFWFTIRQPATPEQMDRTLVEVPQLKPFQGDDSFDHIGWGESMYLPATTNTMRADGPLPADAMAQVKRLADALAKQGIHVNAHVEMQTAIDAYLDQYETVNRSTPIKGLRWVFSHVDQVTDAQLERMKRLGMSAQLHSRPLIQGALMHKVHGEKAWDMPPFRRVQDSGIHWGLGSDATAVTPSNPFYTLGFAVTGKMVGGRQVNRQTITREEALIAHTRSNAYFLFQESNIGSLTRGRYADLLVLDRDYLTVPADEIKDIRPLMTMVGGRIVYDAMPQ
jgi:predicted amidohydrolase YtcJ